MAASERCRRSSLQGLCVHIRWRRKRRPTEGDGNLGFEQREIVAGIKQFFTPETLQLMLASFGNDANMKPVPGTEIH